MFHNQLLHLIPLRPWPLLLLKVFAACLHLKFVLNSTSFGLVNKPDNFVCGVTLQCCWGHKSRVEVIIQSHSLKVFIITFNDLCSHDHFFRVSNFQSQSSHYLYQAVSDITRHSIKVKLQNYTPTKDSTG